MGDHDGVHLVLERHSQLYELLAAVDQGHDLGVGWALGPGPRQQALGHKEGQGSGIVLVGLTDRAPDDAESLTLQVVQERGRPQVRINGFTSYNICDTLTYILHTHLKEIS